MNLASLSREARAALLEEAEKTLAQESLKAFCQRTDPAYMSSAHMDLVIEHLENLERGEITNLAIFMPPRHSKTFHASERFPAWFLGRNPRANVISIGYSQDLANTVSRKVRDLVSDDSWPFDVRIRDDASAVEQWITNKGGVYMAAGVGGPITGKGFNLLVMDDVIKSRADIDSLAKSDKLYVWFNEVVLTRAMPGNLVRKLIVSTRWSDLDLPSRILADSPEPWTVLRLPALSEGEDKDPLKRQEGEALWPSAFPKERLEQLRESLGSKSFSALYQQQPVPEDGTAFQSDWLSQRFDSIPAVEIMVPAEPSLFKLPGTMRVIERPAVAIQAVDASWGMGTSSDFSAIVTVRYDGWNFYVTDCYRARLSHPDLVKAIVAKYREHKPRAVIIEKAQAGIAALQSLQLHQRVPVYGVPPRGSKEARVDSVLPLFEAGRVKFARNAPWLETLLDELLRFPNASHDDCVDALVYCLMALTESIKVTYSSVTDADRNRNEKILRYNY